jgi:hypothetical protein
MMPAPVPKSSLRREIITECAMCNIFPMDKAKLTSDGAVRKGRES